MPTLHAVRYRLASDSLNSVQCVQRLLPIGVQLLGPPNGEPLLVSLACQLTAFTGHTRRQPAGVGE